MVRLVRSYSVFCFWKATVNVLLLSTLNRSFLAFKALMYTGIPCLKVVKLCHQLQSTCSRCALEFPPGTLLSATLFFSLDAVCLCLASLPGWELKQTSNKSFQGKWASCASPLTQE